MATIKLDWREAQQERLPMVCAVCGDEASEFVERRLRAVGVAVFWPVVRWGTVRLPYCPRHVAASWNSFMRVAARSMGSDGIVLGQVSEDFVDAVWDWREGPVQSRRQAQEAVAVVPEADEADRLARPRPKRTTESNRILYGALMTLGVLLVVPCCGGGLFFVSFFLLGNKTPQRPGIDRRSPALPMPRGPDFPGKPPRR